MSVRDRRAVMIGAIVLLPGFLYIWAVRPYADALSDARDRLATERATLARERAAVAATQQNPRLQYAADSAMRVTRPRLFAGKDDVMASAELASYVGEVARKTRVWLQSASTRPAAPTADGVRTLRVEIRAESDLLGTLMFLQALERGDKLVRVDRVDISHSSPAGDEDTEALSIAATISGFAVNDTVTTAALPQPTVAAVSPTASIRR